MNKTKSILIVCGLFILVAVASYFAGYQVASSKMEKEQNLEQTFYATITDIRDANFEVQGIDVNDINHRGSFTFSVSEKTKMEWRGEELTVTDFKPGDLISLTYSDGVLEIYPAQIQEVKRIQLLNDEK